ncbi:MAG: D-alanyl-D-alanine carboxypeptidase, partial [Comamonas sp.]
MFLKSIVGWRWSAPVRAALCLCFSLPALAGPALQSSLPPTVVAALARAQLPPDAVSVLVVEAEAGRGAAPRLAWQPERPMNPASVMKLVTTFAALDQLGPAYTWRTPFYFGGPVQAGVLRGPLYIQGQGDPRLVMERLWLAL